MKTNLDKSFLEIIHIDEIMDYFKKHQYSDDKWETNAGGTFETENHNGIFIHRPYGFELSIMLAEPNCICGYGFGSVECDCEWNADDYFFEMTFSIKEWEENINTIKLF